MAFPACGGRSESRSSLAGIRASGTLRVGMNPGYKPFETRTPEGGWEGFDLDLAHELARVLGVKLEIVQSEWDPVISNLNARKFDVIISGMTRTPERALSCDFSVPYFKTGQVVMVSAKLHPPGSLKSPLDLDRAGVVLSTRLGTTGEVAARKFFSHTKIRTFDGESEAALEVDAARADAMVFDQPFLASHAKEVGGRVYLMDQLLTSEFLAMAVRKGDSELLAALDAALAAYKRGPGYAASYRKWFGGEPPAMDF